MRGPFVLDPDQILALLLGGIDLFGIHRDILGWAPSLNSSDIDSTILKLVERLHSYNTQLTVMAE